MRKQMCFGFNVAVKLQVGCGDFRKQVENMLANLCVFALALYVGLAFLILPQLCLRGRLDFAFALFFSVCFGVGYAFLSTPPA